MKRLITLLIAIFTTVSFSQNEQERAKIVEYYKTINDKTVVFDSIKYSFTEKNDADNKAISLGIPLEVIDSKGNIGKLVRFNEGQPVYYSTNNAGAALTTRANLVQPGGSMGLNLSGLNMIAGVWDQNHPRLSHNDYKNSAGISRLLAVDGPSPNGTSNHSSHVTGTVLSNGLSSTNLSGRGIAYDAEGWIFDWNNDKAEMNQYAGFGLLISNHSYGAIASNLSVWNFGAYVSDSNAVDNICFNNPKYIPVYAAGNDRDSFSTLNPSKNGNDLLNGDITSKNSIVVGAVNSVPTYLNSSSVVMSNFSSFGPTDDFRIKPDLVAKGVNVFSISSSSDTAYASLNGTSMASPGVASSLLLVQQYFGSPFLNASTLKGLALHTADEAGPSEGPDHMFGWGLLNTAKMVETLQKNNVESVVSENTLNNNQTYFIDVLALGDEPLKASISWTDRPGVAATAGVVDQINSRLVNDLDVTITKLAETHLPWKLNKDWSNITAVKGNNDVDPFERVDVLNPSGIYRVNVSHKGSLTGGTQNYSLVITGVDADANLDLVKFDKNDFLLWNFAKILNYEIENWSDVLNMKIFDINGRLIFQDIIESQSGMFDLNKLNSGFYNVVISDKSNVIVAKKIIL